LEPLVSIVINNYNYAQYLGNAIESALQQQYRNAEVIVVDDGSEDDSREVISRYGSNVKPVFKANGGQSSAFNAGFDASRGEIICFLDSDDIFLPTKVKRVVEVVAERPRSWCFHQLRWTNANLEPTPTPSIPFATGFYDFRAEFLRGKCLFSPPATSGLAFSRSLLDRVMPVPEDIRITSDNYLKFAVLAIEPGYFIAEQLGLQRIHGNNAYTGRGDATLKANVQLVTAAGLRAKIPALRPFCNRMFADGLVKKWLAGASVGTVSRELWRYFGDLSFAEKTETLARIAVKGTRQGIRLQMGAIP
jgi:glycosyltransferase involved in cell wall biosynthesis